LYAVGLLPYCNFGTWTAEEDQQLRKNWEKIVQVQYRCYIQHCNKDCFQTVMLCGRRSIVE